jgi:hypothetical protein
VGAGALFLELELCGTGEGDTSSDSSAEPVSEGAGCGGPRSCASSYPSCEGLEWIV